MFCTIVLTMDIEGSPLPAPALKPAAPPPLPKSARRAQSMAIQMQGAVAVAARRGKGGRKAKTVGDAHTDATERSSDATERSGRTRMTASESLRATATNAVLAAARKSGERRGRGRTLSGVSSLQGSQSNSPLSGSSPSGGTPPLYSSGSGVPSPLASPTVQAYVENPDYRYIYFVRILLTC